MQDIQRRQLGVLETALLKLLKLVGANFTTALVLAPVVGTRETADGQAFLGDGFPELALGLVAEGDTTLCDGEDEVRVGERLLLGGSQPGDADFLTALLERVGLEEALLGAFADG